jgi:hypothetical protein
MTQHMQHVLSCGHLLVQQGQGSLNAATPAVGGQGCSVGPGSRAVYLVFCEQARLKCLHASAAMACMAVQVYRKRAAC